MSDLETTTEGCPRCGAEHEAVYYGPCAACRIELRINAAHRRFVNFLVRGRWFA